MSEIFQQGAAVAVLRGAVLYGLDPAIVHVRRATKTYGIGIIKPFNWKLHPRGQLPLHIFEILLYRAQQEGGLQVA